MVLLVLVVPILIGLFLLAMERLEVALLPCRDLEVGRTPGEAGTARAEADEIGTGEDACSDDAEPGPGPAVLPLVLGKRVYARATGA